MRSQGLELAGKLRVGMRTAADNDRRLSGRLPDPDGLCGRIALLAPCPRTAGTEITDLRHRHVNHAHDGAVIADERDIDGEFTIAFYELPGTVKGVDEPVALPVAACLEGDVGGLLGQQRDLGGQFGESLHDDFVRCHVRLGEGGLVGFLFH